LLSLTGHPSCRATGELDAQLAAAAQERSKVFKRRAAATKAA
jgi:hypothetical protein